METFAGLLAANDISFRHGDDADFDAELALEQQVREYARGRRALMSGR